jgi:plastocyanin
MSVVMPSVPVDRASAGSPDRSDVRVLDDFFLPSLSSAGRGWLVVWDFADAERTHSVTDSTGMELFDSGFVAPGGPAFTHRFTAAGRYPYLCTIHALMTGRVSVPVLVRPASGPLGRAYTVRWAAGRPADGFVYDVQVRRPGGPWSSWLSGVSDPKDEFEPSRRGAFRFRARLRQTSGGRAEWSRVASLSVT